MEREERKVMGSGKVAITPQRKRGKSQRPSPNNVLYHVQLLKRIISNEVILFLCKLFHIAHVLLDLFSTKFNAIGLLR